MLRFVCAAVCNAAINSLKSNVIRIPRILPPVQQYSHLVQSHSMNLLKKPILCTNPIKNAILGRQTDIVAQPLLIQNRTVIKFSMKKGKRKSVKTVLKRFYRLQWGGWIRTMSGRNKKMWKRSESNKRRMKHHVICNSTQSHMLDKMVTKFWRKPKYYVDDIYKPYHCRENFYFTRKRPMIRG